MKQHFGIGAREVKRQCCPRPIHASLRQLAPALYADNSDVYLSRAWLFHLSIFTDESMEEQAALCTELWGYFVQQPPCFTPGSMKTVSWWTGRVEENRNIHSGFFGSRGYFQSCSCHRSLSMEALACFYKDLIKPTGWMKQLRLSFCFIYSIISFLPLSLWASIVVDHPGWWDLPRPIVCFLLYSIKAAFISLCRHSLDLCFAYIPNDNLSRCAHLLSIDIS